MSKMKEKYLEEYEKYKHVQLILGEYRLKSNRTVVFSILNIEEASEKALIRSTASGVERERTLHWCRKNLELV
jgi:hypothetical protein